MHRREFARRREPRGANRPRNSTGQWISRPRGTRDADPPGMDILTWLIVGLVSGVLASLVVGGYGLLADIVIGIVGAFVGGWLFRSAGWSAPWDGLAGTIFVAFIGAVILLVLLRVLRGARRY
jgi:uncharacterized membrane protein YeaQ/YmgE (transglycosylase-associated protein family)